MVGTERDRNYPFSTLVLVFTRGIRTHKRSRNANLNKEVKIIPCN
jgi:hypothetical protein